MKYLYRNVLVLLVLMMSFGFGDKMTIYGEIEVGENLLRHEQTDLNKNDSVPPINNYIRSNRDFLELGPTPTYYGHGNNIGYGRGIVIYANEDFVINSFGIFGQLYSEEFLVSIYNCPNGNVVGDLLFSHSDLSGGLGLAWNDISFDQNFTFNQGEYYFLNWQPVDNGWSNWSYDHGLDYYEDFNLPISFGPLTLIDGTSLNTSGSVNFFNTLHAFFRINVVNSESGCTDPSACNYDPDALEDDGSCSYIEDCFGECGGDAAEDCAGECNGNAIEDECGVCEGDNSTCTGCSDSEALNYDENVIFSDGCCIYYEDVSFEDLSDLNNDGIVNILDLMTLINYILEM